MKLLNDLTVAPIAGGGTRFVTVNNSGVMGATTLGISDVGGLSSALSGKASVGAIGGSNLTMNSARILGRTSASAGAIEEITIGSGLSLSGGSLSTSLGISDISGLSSALSGKASTGAVGSSGLTMNTARILGRTTASAGGVEEISIGTGLSLSSGTLSCTVSGGSGTVTSFSSGSLGAGSGTIFTTSVSNATTTPALSFSLVTQAANVVFAGPSSGGSANPAFRSLVSADLPSHSHAMSDVTGLSTALSGKAAAGAIGSSGLTMSTARLLGRSSASSGAIEEISIGTGLTLSGGSLTRNALSESDIPNLSADKITTGYFPSTRLANTSITSGNILYSDGTNSYWAPPGPSDARLKEAIEPFRLGLDLIRQLDPKQWRWNGLGHEKKGKRGVGFIAQENLTKLDFCIFTNPAKLRPDDTSLTELYHLDQTPLIAVLANAVKELSAEVDDLKSQLKLK